MLIDGAMGAISLFPLLGRIEKLKGFYPPRLRSWYITFSTLFSLIIYIRVQYFFENLVYIPVLLSPEFTALAAMISLFVYIGAVLSVNPTYTISSSKQKVIYIIATLFVYFILIGSLTCTFNVLENLREYEIKSGNIFIDGQKVTKKVKILIDIPEIDEPQRKSKKDGSFLFIIKKDKYERINTIRFVTEDDRFSSILGPRDFPETEKWEINLKEQF